MTPPIVLIHGLWLTPRGWEGWRAHFKEREHEFLASAWPRLEGKVEDIRHEPSDCGGLF